MLWFSPIGGSGRSACIKVKGHSDSIPVEGVVTQRLTLWLLSRNSTINSFRPEHTKRTQGNEIVPTGYGCALSHGISRNYTPPSLPLNSTPQAGGPSAARYAERQKERRRRTLTGQPGKQHAARGPICLSKPKPAMVKAEMVTHAVVKLSGQFANGAPCSCIGKLNGRIIRELPS